MGITSTRFKFWLKLARSNRHFAWTPTHVCVDSSSARLAQEIRHGQWAGRNRWRSFQFYCARPSNFDVHILRVSLYTFFLFRCTLPSSFVVHILPISLSVNFSIRANAYFQQLNWDEAVRVVSCSRTWGANPVKDEAHGRECLQYPHCQPCWYPEGVSLCLTVSCVNEINSIAKPRSPNRKVCPRCVMPGWYSYMNELHAVCRTVLMRGEGGGALQLSGLRCTDLALALAVTCY